MNSMLDNIRNSGRGLFMLIAVAALLLFSDRGNRKNSSNAIVEIALMQYASRPTLDLCVKGYADALAAANFIDGINCNISQYNAENDLPTANTIASEIINRSYNIVLTASTPALQTMANANRAGEVIHVFGAVTDPFAAGVGLSRNDSSLRPPWLCGMGTFQPVEEAFYLARKLYPSLKRVGVPWCNHETCSEACVRKARIVCEELGIELLEANVENSAFVLEAARSLVSRGAEALWIGGDNTVEIAADMMIKAGREAGIPVFTNNPDHPPLGALFGMGANYYEVGLAVGKIAVKVLQGAHPIDITVQNHAPLKLYLNVAALQELKDDWLIPQDVMQKADSVFYH